MIATGPGIVCPKCGTDHCAVTDSRGGEGYIRRRRQCHACWPPVRFTTVELVIGSSARVNLAHMAEPVLKAMQLQTVLEKMPTPRRTMVLALIADLAALAEKETVPGAPA